MTALHLQLPVQLCQSCPPHPSRLRHARRQRVQAQPRTQSQPPADPFAEREEYKDNFFSKLMIGYFTSKMATSLGGLPYEKTYDSFVELSREVMKGRTSEQQRSTIADVLDSLMPQEAQQSFKNLFPPNKFSAEINARITCLGFAWLVGPMELQDAEVQYEGKTQQWRSKVLIKKCRYLEASGCIGMCTNMCQRPTQDFFKSALGLPLTMAPNFEDLSCEMTFGAAPPPFEEDPVYTQPCFPHVCKLGNRDAASPCPKVDTGTSPAKRAAAKQPAGAGAV